MNKIIMNLSGIYKEESFMEGSDLTWVELSDLSGTNCYCDDEAMGLIRSRIQAFSPQGLHFIDSGNYHYMTRIWLEKLDQPFRLLVFDNHTDMQPPAFGGLLSCGGWIGAALTELSYLKEVILIGPDEAAFAATEAKFREKVRFLSREVLAFSSADLVKKFLKGIPTDLPLYISVDKDILRPGDAATSWSQGDMSLNALTDCLDCVFAHFKDQRAHIYGCDICGEQSMEKLESNPPNDRANLALLKLWEKWTEEK